MSDGRWRILIAAGAVLLAVAVAAVVGVLLSGEEEVPPVKPSGTVSRATLEADGLGEFSQVNELAGKLELSTERANGGTRSVRATYDGDAENGYARTIYNVDWKIGDSVAYSAAFFIPKATLDAVQGQVSLMRWDDFPERPDDANYGGLVIFGRDLRMHVVSAQLDNGDEQQTMLTDAIDVPVDRWFTVEVRQRLGDEKARSEVYLDGDLVADSPQPNIPGDRAVTRVRYGIVSTAGAAQQRPLELWIDDVTAQPGAVPGG